MIGTTPLRGFLMATAALVVAAVSALTQDEKSPPKPFVEEYVRATMSAPPASLGVDPFYKLYTDALGIAILSSEKVPDAALLVARDIVIHMLAKRPDLRAEMLKKKMRVGVMAQSESTTDIPEHRNNKKPAGRSSLDSGRTSEL